MNETQAPVHVLTLGCNKWTCVQAALTLCVTGILVKKRGMGSSCQQSCEGKTLLFHILKKFCILSLSLFKQFSGFYVPVCMVYLLSFTTIITVNCRTFSSSQKETLTLLAVIVHFSPCRPWQPLVYFLSPDLHPLNVSYKWNHTAYGPCVWLCSNSIMFSRFICVEQCLIPFYG